VRAVHRPINPEELAAPVGYSHGVLCAPGHTLYVAGQIGWTAEAKLVGPGFVEQFGQALRNIAVVVTNAGGRPEHIARLTVYVTDKRQYLADTRGVGQAYRAVMGKHFPAMALVEVKDLLEAGALVEIEATAVIPAA
jgi:enamine deaminase RidA (YjgF/YER057c/UK114 family)